MNCACRCRCSQRKPVTKSTENSKETNFQSARSNSCCCCKSVKIYPSIVVTHHNCSCSSSPGTRIPLKDLKNKNILSGEKDAAACKSTRRTPKVKRYSTYSVTPKMSLNNTHSLNAIGASEYIKEAFKNKNSKKTINKKVVSPSYLVSELVSPKPKPEQTAFCKEIILVKNNFKPSEHHTIKIFAPLLKMNFISHYTKEDFIQLGYIFDGVPTNSEWKPSEQENTTPFCNFNLLSNVEVVTVDGKEELLPLNFLQDVRARIGLRTTIVNWLVNVQTYLDAGNSVLFMAIKIFDKLLAKHKIENNKFQLYATAAFWICYNHYNSQNTISALDLLKLTLNRHSVHELFITAKDILQFLNYKLHTDLQIVHVYNFVCVILKISDSYDIYNCAHFFSEILMLDPNCNCYSVSLQACASVYLALKLFNYNEHYFEKLDSAYWSHKPSEMTEIHRKIIEFVLLMSDSQYRYRNSFFKYSTRRYGQISEKVTKIIIPL